MMQNGTKSRTGKRYLGHFDVRTLNHLQQLLERASKFIPSVHLLTGWSNTSLYVSSSEIFGILPVPESLAKGLDMQTFHSSIDAGSRHRYLASRQGTRYAVTVIHTIAERQRFSHYMRTNALFSSDTRDWTQCARIWNKEANGVDVFYKVSAFCL
jgi:hypothetical protein